MTVLECHHQNPFSAGWSDWFAPENNVGLTFQTMCHQLCELWRIQCKYSIDGGHKDGTEPILGEQIVDHSQFRPDELLSPGIHREIDSDGYEHYEVIVPHDRLHPKICEGWIERINSEYERDYELLYSED